jgi:transcriptional regulator with XRE-family HTH domain
VSPDPNIHPVRLAREAKGMRLEDLARAIGKSASLISNIEHGFLAKPGTCMKIAEALDKDINDLWPGEFRERAGN